MSTNNTREAIRRFQARQRIVLRWLIAPAMVSGALMFCSVALHWPRWLAYVLFIVFFSILLLILTMRRCPFCGTTVSVGIGSPRRPEFQRCPRRSKPLCNSSAE